MFTVVVVVNLGATGIDHRDREEIGTMLIGCILTPGQKPQIPTEVSCC